MLWYANFDFIHVPDLLFSAIIITVVVAAEIS